MNAQTSVASGCVPIVVPFDHRGLGLIHIGGVVVILPVEKFVGI